MLSVFTHSTEILLAFGFNKSWYNCGKLIGFLLDNRVKKKVYLTKWPTTFYEILKYEVLTSRPPYRNVT